MVAYYWVFLVGAKRSPLIGHFVASTPNMLTWPLSMVRPKRLAAPRVIKFNWEPVSIKARKLLFHGFPLNTVAWHVPRTAGELVGSHAIVFTSCYCSGFCCESFDFTSWSLFYCSRISFSC